MKIDTQDEQAIRKIANEWLESDQWLREHRDPWINGRAHPDLVLLLLDRIAELERAIVEAHKNMESINAESLGIKVE